MSPRSTRLLEHVVLVGDFLRVELFLPERARLRHLRARERAPPVLGRAEQLGGRLVPDVGVLERALGDGLVALEAREPGLLLEGRAVEPAARELARKLRL